jgi:hypothetical protein
VARGVSRPVRTEVEFGWKMEKALIELSRNNRGLTYGTEQKLKAIIYRGATAHIDKMNLSSNLKF